MKSILFPFNIEHDNQAAFNQAMDLARMNQATVVFLTCFKKLSPAIEDNIYFHLLALHGHYQTYCNNWKGSLKVVTEQVIKVETHLQVALADFLQENTIDFIVPTEAVRN